MSNITGNVIQNINGDINGNITTTGNMSVINKVASTNINGTTNISRNMNVNGNMSQVGNIDTNALFLKGSLDICGNIIGNVTGNISNSTLNVTGNIITSIDDNSIIDFNIPGNLDVSANANIGGMAILNNGRVVNNLDVSGNTMMSGTLSTTGLATLNNGHIVNNLDVSGNTMMSGTLSTTGLATLNNSRVVNNLDVSGNTMMSGTLSTTGLATLNNSRVVNNLDVSGNTMMSGTLSTTGLATLNNSRVVNNLDVSGNLTASSSTISLGTNSSTVTIKGVAPTNTNTSNAIVLRDSNGGFSAGTIVADLSGNSTSSTKVTISSSGGNGLYSFSAFTFTNASKTGRTGPTLSQCRTAYSSTSWTQDTTHNYLNMTSDNGIQKWTVPSTGLYTIRAAGAKGGDAGPQTGGKGRIVEATYNLTQGQVINILVGQKGTQGGPWTTFGTSNYAGSGGGGSFIINSSNNSILLIAGGGGGADSNPVWGSTGAKSNGNDAPYTNAGTNATGGTGSTGGNGGNPSADFGYVTGGGGGGFSGDGSYVSSFGNPTSPDGNTLSTIIGKSYSNGGNGGYGFRTESQYPVGADGGFGGGGGTRNDNSYAPGGGGGYSGGDGAAAFFSSGASQTAYAGGGGGYYSNGSSTSDIGTNNDDGYVTITPTFSITGGVSLGSSYIPIITSTSGVLTLYSNNNFVYDSSNNMLTVGKLVGDISGNISGSTSIGGNTTVAGTLGITGASKLSSTLDVSGNTMITGTLLTEGTISTLGNMNVNGNSILTGTTRVVNNLDVSGNTLLSGTLGVINNLSINSNKFTVASSTGDTNVAGSLTVSGDTTLNGSIINIGTSGSTVNIMGTTNNVQTTNLDVTDKLVRLNKNGALGSAGGAGIEIEENSIVVGYIKTASNRASYLIKTPAGSEATILSDTIMPTNNNTNSAIVKRSITGDFSANTLELSGDIDINGNVKMKGISSSTTSNILYYDTSSKSISYGSNSGSSLLSSNNNWTGTNTFTNTINGNITGNANYANFSGGTYSFVGFGSPSTDPSPLTIAYRDVSGNIKTTKFIGDLSGNATTANSINGYSSISSSNVNNSIVVRDNNGGFNAGIIVADISGNSNSSTKIIINTNTGDALYNFSTFTFTNADKTGRTGPTLSQCRTSYSSVLWTQDTNNNFLNMTSNNGIQKWTVPETGQYIIRAAGAMGGNAGSYTGGKGRIVQGTFSLTKGQIINILVGQKGVESSIYNNNNDTNSGGSGGGGTFVIDNSNNILLIAGGGGGASDNSSYIANPPFSPGGSTYNGFDAPFSTQSTSQTGVYYDPVYYDVTIKTSDNINTIITGTLIVDSITNKIISFKKTGSDNNILLDIIPPFTYNGSGFSVMVSGNYIDPSGINQEGFVYYNNNYDITQTYGYAFQANPDNIYKTTWNNSNYNGKFDNNGIVIIDANNTYLNSISSNGYSPTLYLYSKINPSTQQISLYMKYLQYYGSPGSYSSQEFPVNIAIQTSSNDTVDSQPVQIINTYNISITTSDNVNTILTGSFEVDISTNKLILFNKTGGNDNILLDSIPPVTYNGSGFTVITSSNNMDPSGTNQEGFRYYNNNYNITQTYGYNFMASPDNIYKATWNNSNYNGKFDNNGIVIIDASNTYLNSISSNGYSPTLYLYSKINPSTQQMSSYITYLQYFGGPGYYSTQEIPVNITITFDSSSNNASSDSNNVLGVGGNANLIDNKITGGGGGGFNLDGNYVSSFGNPSSPEGNLLETIVGKSYSNGGTGGSGWREVYSSPMSADGGFGGGGAVWNNSSFGPGGGGGFNGGDGSSGFRALSNNLPVAGGGGGYYSNGSNTTNIGTNSNHGYVMIVPTFNIVSGKIITSDAYIPFTPSVGSIELYGDNSIKYDPSSNKLTVGKLKLENINSTSTSNVLYYDTVTKEISYQTGFRFTKGATQPVNGNNGDEWYSTNNNNLYKCIDGNWYVIATFNL